MRHRTHLGAVFRPAAQKRYRASDGLRHELRQIALKAYDRTIGLGLSNVAVDGCIIKAPCGGEKAGRSPVDQGKMGFKRSMAVDAKGIPLGAVSAAANRH